jgi:hypothetical protein
MTRWMKGAALAAFLLAAVGPVPARALAPPPGFTPLFNGKDLKGFRFLFPEGTPQDPARYVRVADGTLVFLKPDPPIYRPYLLTEKTYRDFALRFEWRYPVPAGTDPAAADYRELTCFAYVDGFRSLNIGLGRDHPGHVSSSGTKYDSLFSKESSLRAPGEWNSAEIIGQDGKLAVTVNGQKAHEVTHFLMKEGAIGWGARDGEAHLRNVLIKPLGNAPPPGAAVRS